MEGTPANKLFCSERDSARRSNKAPARARFLEKIKQKVYSTIKYNNGFGLYVFVWEFSAMRFGKTPFVSQNL